MPATDPSPDPPPPADDPPTADTSPSAFSETFGGWRVVFLVLAAAAVIIPLAWGLIVLAQSPSTAGDTPSETAVEPLPLVRGASGYVVAPPNDTLSWFVTILTVPEGLFSRPGLPEPASGYRWIGFEVEVTGDSAVEVGELSWTATDSLGIERPRILLNPPSESAEELAYTLLDTGDTASGWIYFQVSADATIKSLRVEPASFPGTPLLFASN